MGDLSLMFLMLISFRSFQDSSLEVSAVSEWQPVHIVTGVTKPTKLIFPSASFLCFAMSQPGRFVIEKTFNVGQKLNLNVFCLHRTHSMTGSETTEFTTSIQRRTPIHTTPTVDSSLHMSDGWCSKSTRKSSRRDERLTWVTYWTIQSSNSTSSKLSHYSHSFNTKLNHETENEENNFTRFRVFVLLAFLKVSHHLTPLYLECFSLC